jgi:hypothetical protein
VERLRPVSAATSWAESGWSAWCRTRQIKSVVGSEWPLGRPGDGGADVVRGTEDPVDLLLAGDSPAADPVDGAAQGGVGVQARPQGREGEGFDEVVQGAQAHRGLDGGHVSGCRDHDDVGAVALFPHTVDELEACLVGQVVVEQHQVDGAALDGGQGLGGTVRACGDPETGNSPHVLGIDLGDAEVVVHDQDLDHRASFRQGQPGVDPGFRLRCCNARKTSTTGRCKQKNGMCS